MNIPVRALAVPSSNVTVVDPPFLRLTTLLGREGHRDRRIVRLVLKSKKRDVPEPHDKQLRSDASIRVQKDGDTVPLESIRVQQEEDTAPLESFRVRQEEDTAPLESIRVQQEEDMDSICVRHDEDTDEDTEPLDSIRVQHDEDAGSVDTTVIPSSSLYPSPSIDGRKMDSRIDPYHLYTAGEPRPREPEILPELYRIQPLLPRRWYWVTDLVYIACTTDASPNRKLRRQQKRVRSRTALVGSPASVRDKPFHRGHAGFRRAKSPHGFIGFSAWL